MSKTQGATTRRSSIPWYLWVVIVGALALAVTGMWDADDPATVAGIGLSGIAILLAVLIYSRQQSEQAASEDRIIAASTLKDVAAREDEAGTGPDEYAAEDAELAAEGEDLGDGFWRFPASKIPLTVIGDLVQGWAKSGKTGRWSVGDLSAAVRRRHGKGNHPWFIETYDPDESRPRFWKLGKGNGGIRVTEVEDPARQLAS